MNSRCSAARISCWLLLLLVLVSEVAAGPARTFADVARSFGEKLPRGCLVSGELSSGSRAPVFSVSGKAEPEGVPAGKRMFEIGSISKVFTGLLLAQTVVEGKAKLDSTLAALLGKEQTFADAAVGRITLEQLATHTSGLPRIPADLAKEDEATDPLKDPYASFDRKKLSAFLATHRMQSPPPYQASYSNLGTGLLGDVLARIHGKTWEELVREKIAGPLGLVDTVVTLGPEQEKRLAPPYRGSKVAHGWHFQALAGAGALRSTAADMMLFGMALANPDSTPLKQAFALALKPRADYAETGGKIGLNILSGHVAGEAVLEHNGGTGGYRSSLQVFPRTGRVLLLLSNNGDAPVEAVGAAMSAPAGPAAKRREHPRTAAQLAPYPGVYRLGAQARFTVLAIGDQLWVRLTGQPFLRVFADDPTGERFSYREVQASIEFARSAPGSRVVSLTLFQNGRKLVAPRSEEPLPAIKLRPAAELQAYAGTYDLPPAGVVTVSVHNDTLFAQLTGQPALPVFETGRDRFEYDVVQAALVFERDAKGKVTGLALHQNGAVLKGTRAARR